MSCSCCAAVNCKVHCQLSYQSFACIAVDVVAFKYQPLEFSHQDEWSQNQWEDSKWLITVWKIKTSKTSRLVSCYRPPLQCFIAFVLLLPQEHLLLTCPECNVSSVYSYYHPSILYHCLSCTQGAGAYPSCVKAKATQAQTFAGDWTNILSVTFMMGRPDLFSASGASW